MIEMKKIMLFCSAGMSTSLLVNKMKQAAKNRNIDVDIFAVASTDYERHLKKSDVCLLGPQVRYMLSEAKEIGQAEGVPVDVSLR